jgi:RHS repeat-associated protein
MLKDHLGNVRMVLTEEIQTNIYPAATLEGTFSPTGTAQANSMVNTEKQFYRIDNTKIISESAIASWVSPAETVANTKLYYNNNGNPPANTNYPAGCTPLQTDGSAKVYKLNATTNKTGLEFIIKVMAGDKIDIFGKSYFLNTATVNNTNSTALDLAALMTNLLTAPGNGIAAKGVTPAQLNTWNTGLVPSTFFRGANGETTTIPKAYINYIFLDEQFKYAGGNFSRVGSSGVVKNHWNTDVQLQNISVPKNGYIFVYISNESNLDVFFDNLQVIHKPGPILEETHYYPFGLTIAGISSKAAGMTTNRYKYNGIAQNTDLDLNMYDAYYRNLDPQIGRFWQPDPVTTHSESLYAAMQNNPVSKNDWLGNYFTWANGTVEDTYKKMREENSKRKGDYFNQLIGILRSGEKGMGEQVEQLANLVNMHSDLENQWDEMANSGVEFHVSSETPQKGAGGATRYSMEDKRVDIRLGANEKNISMMSHELRHGYGYLNGEMIAGGNGLYDITDELVAYQAGYLLSNKDAVQMVVDGKVNLEWFKTTHLNTDLYRHLTGREESITLNTPAAVYMKYFDDRLSRFMPSNKNNANMTVNDAVDAANIFSQNNKKGNEYLYGNLLKNRNP